MNLVILVGLVSKDPEIRMIGDNKKVAQLSLATTSARKNKAGEQVKETTFHNSIIWYDPNRALDYIKKGTPIEVQGRLHNRKYEKDGRDVYVSEIIVDRVGLIAKSSSPQADAPANASASVPELTIPDGNDGFNEDDLPF
jgi:single-strand DNA-binding protein